MANQPTPLRAYSASDFSAVEGTLRDSLCYDRDEVDLEHFELDESESECEKKKNFAVFLKAALAEARDEKQLQDSVFTLLHDHHDRVYILEDSMRNQFERRNPKETKKEKSRRKAAAEKKNNFLQRIKTNVANKFPLLESLADKFVDAFEEVAERHTRTILDLYAKDIECMPTIDTKMKEAEHGIFIKTSSRPDIVAMIENKKDILFAEIKNAENYSNDDAISQEICYLMLLLYWWRVVCARDVEKVRGFTVCGPRCSSNIERKRGIWGEQQKYYHVSLIEMSIPNKLGELNTATIWEGRFSITDSTGINALYDFLSTDHLWNNVQNFDELTFPHCKAWMTLPEGFMDICSDNLGWDLVEGGTPAVVVRCEGSSGLLSFVNSGIMTPGGSTQMKTKWHVLRQDEYSSDIYYVKVKTIATERAFQQDPSKLWNGVVSFKNYGLVPSKLYNDFLKAYPDIVSANALQPPSGVIRNLCQDFLKTYPFEPVGYNDFYAVVMNNRGKRRLDNPDSLQGVAETLFTERFWVLWRNTVLFSLLFKFWHGDVAAFNIIVDDDTDDLNFILIDWDEAAKHPKSRLGNSLLCRMKHHETLRIKSQQVYTDVQFALTYCQLQNERYGPNNWNVESDDLLKDFPKAILSEDKKRVETEAEIFVQGVKAQISRVIGTILD